METHIYTHKKKNVYQISDPKYTFLFVKYKRIKKQSCIMRSFGMKVLFGLQQCITYILYKFCGYGLVVLVYCTFSYYDDIKPFLISTILQGKKSADTYIHTHTHTHTGENREGILTSFTALELMGFLCLSVTPSATMIILRREPLQDKHWRTETSCVCAPECVHECVV